MVYTDLYSQLVHGHKSEALELIKELHPDSETTPCGSFANTPLHIAAEKGYYPVVELLIRDKVDINAQNKFGETPLHLSVMLGHDDITELLLQANADATITNHKGETAFNQALRMTKLA